MAERCVFKIDDRKCSALTKKVCGWCHFYKTEKQLDESRAKAEERLHTLPQDRQRELADKYMGEEG